MKTAHNVFVSIAIAFMLTGLNACKKDKSSNETNVSGTVIEYGSNTSIAGTTVIIQKADADAFLSYAYSNYLVTKTDANGKCFGYHFKSGLSFK